MEGSELLFDEDFEHDEDDGDPDFDFQSEQQFLNASAGMIIVNLVLKKRFDLFNLFN